MQFVEFGFTTHKQLVKRLFKSEPDKAQDAETEPTAAAATNNNPEAEPAVADANNNAEVEPTAAAAGVTANNNNNNNNTEVEPTAAAATTTTNAEPDDNSELPALAAEGSGDDYSVESDPYASYFVNFIMNMDLDDIESASDDNAKAKPTVAATDDNTEAEPMATVAATNDNAEVEPAAAAAAAADIQSAIADNIKAKPTVDATNDNTEAESPAATTATDAAAEAPGKGGGDDEHTAVTTQTSLDTLDTGAPEITTNIFWGPDRVHLPPEIVRDEMGRFLNHEDRQAISDVAGIDIDDL